MLKQCFIVNRAQVSICTVLSIEKCSYTSRPRAVLVLIKAPNRPHTHIWHIIAIIAIIAMIAIPAAAAVPIQHGRTKRGESRRRHGMGLCEVCQWCWGVVWGLLFRTRGAGAAEEVLKAGAAVWCM